MKRAAFAVVSTAKLWRRPRRSIAATPTGIESCLKPVVFVKTSARKGFEAPSAVALSPPQENEKISANRTGSDRHICFAFQLTDLVLTHSIK